MKLNIKQYIVLLSCIYIFTFLTLRIYMLITDPLYYAFPAVTQCRICDKTVWIWQRYEIRKYKIKGVNASFFSVGMSGIVHEWHEGTHEMEVQYKNNKITID